MAVRWFWPLIAVATACEAIAAVFFLRSWQEWERERVVRKYDLTPHHVLDLEFLLAGILVAALGGVAFALAAKRR